MHDQDMTATMEYLEYVDNLAAELSGLKVEELDELTVDDKEKIVNTITQKAFSMLNFTKPSQQ